MAENSRHGENDFDDFEFLVGKEKVRDIRCFFVSLFLCLFCEVVEKLLHLDSQLQLPDGPY